MSDLFDPRQRRLDYPVPIGYAEDIEVALHCDVCGKFTVWHASYGRGLYCKEHKPVDQYTVTLTDIDLAYSHALAGEMQRVWGTGDEHEYTTFGEDSGREPWSFEVSAKGEVGIAKCCDFARPFSVDDRKGACDFGPRDGPGIAVRTKEVREYPKLIVRPQDKDNSIAVLCVILDKYRVRVHAWAWIAEVKLAVPLEDPPVWVHNPDGTRELKKINYPMHWAPMNPAFMHFLPEDPIPFDKLGPIEKGYRVCGK